MPVNSTETFPAEWYTIAAEGHFWFEWRCRVFLRQLQYLGLPYHVPQKGLEIGCGGGLLRKQVEDATAWFVDGVDLNRDALGKNPQLRGKVFFYNILEQKPELENAYDFLILFDVIEHIQNSRAFIESALYHLRPGGWLFVNVPALPRLRSRYDEVVGHIRRYSHQSMIDELESHNLDIKDLRYWGFLMLPMLILRTISSHFMTSPQQVLNRGLDPGQPYVNQLLLWLMRLETRFIKRPALGTSLMVAAIKTN